MIFDERNRLAWAWPSQRQEDGQLPRLLHGGGGGGSGSSDEGGGRDDGDGDDGDGSDDGDASARELGRRALSFYRDARRTIQALGGTVRSGELLLIDPEAGAVVFKKSAVVEGELVDLEDEDDDDELVDALEEWFEDHADEWTLTDLAEEVGVAAASTLRAWFDGDRSPNSNSRKKIASFLRAHG